MWTWEETNIHNIVNTQFSRGNFNEFKWLWAYWKQNIHWGLNLVLSVTIDLQVPHGHCHLLIPMATGPWSLIPLSSLSFLRQGVRVRKTFRFSSHGAGSLENMKICDKPTMMIPPLLSFYSGTQNSVDTSPCGCLSLLSAASYIMLKCEKVF